MNNATKSIGFLSLNKDFLGFFASMLCAVHCAALPLILTVSALSGLSFLGNHAIEFVFLGISIVVAIWSLVPAYRNSHHNVRPLRIVGLGFVLLAGSRFLPHGFAEHFITAAGGCIVAYAHWMNFKLLKKGTCCEKERCDA